MRALRWTTGTALVLTYCLIVLGAWVRSTGSGLSCPDWPTCYGTLVPLPDHIPLEAGYSYFQVMLEWTHRLVAGVILGPLVLAIAVLAWRARHELARLPLYGGALLVLLLVQALLGGITVLDQNSPWSVALHLGTALVLFSALWLIFVRTGPPAPAAPAALRWLSLAAWLLAFGAMVSAAVVTKSGASLACATWPLCDGAVVPDLRDPLVAWNFTHRVLAAGFVLVLVALFIASRRTDVAPLAGLALMLVAAEVLLGAVLVWLLIPVWAAVAHQALGVLTFALVTFALWRCHPERAARARDLMRVGLSRA